MNLEIPVLFHCGQNELVGVFHQPAEPSIGSCGVLIVVGGPQYRVGSHRQFVTLARDLVEAGISSMRFDYSGMGDSTGEQIFFESTGPDIKAAIDVFMQQCPHIDHVVLWGLCDAASACLMYSISDSRVAGLVLVNPWVRSDVGAAKAHLKHYYKERFFQKQFWLKLIRLKFNYIESFGSLMKNVFKAIYFVKDDDFNTYKENLPFQKKMEIAFANFRNRILFIISGNDLTAAEFKDYFDTSEKFKKKIGHQNVEWIDIEKADHTFSRKKWKTQVSKLTIEWLLKIHA